MSTMRGLWLRRDLVAPHRLHIALVEVFEAGEAHAFRVLCVALDLDDRRHGIARQTEELQAYGARVRGHAMHEKTRGDDDAVGALLLHAGEAGEELVADVLAQPRLAELRARDLQHALAQRLSWSK